MIYLSLSSLQLSEDPQGPLLTPTLKNTALCLSKVQHIYKRMLLPGSLLVPHFLMLTPSKVNYFNICMNFTCLCGSRNTSTSVMLPLFRFNRPTSFFLLIGCTACPSIPPVLGLGFSRSRVLSVRTCLSVRGHGSSCSSCSPRPFIQFQEEGGTPPAACVTSMS